MVTAEGYIRPLAGQIRAAIREGGRGGMNSAGHGEPASLVPLLHRRCTYLIHGDRGCAVDICTMQQSPAREGYESDF